MNAKRELLHEKLTQESLYDAQQDIYSSEERAAAETFATSLENLVVAKSTAHAFDWDPDPTNDSDTARKELEIARENLIQKIMEYL